jgi:hypothetical protein
MEVFDVGTISFMKRNWSKVLSVVLVVALVVLSVMLYDTSRSYYYERNMHRYAMGEEYLVVRQSFYAFAGDVTWNRSDLSRDILQAYSLQKAVERLEYMDPPHYKIWWHVSQASGALHSLAQMDYFPNGSTTSDLSPDQVYPYILSLNASFMGAGIEIEYTVSDQGPWIYNPDGNIFRLNETKLLDADHVSQQLTQLLSDHGLL